MNKSRLRILVVILVAIAYWSFSGERQDTFDTMQATTAKEVLLPEPSLLTRGSSKQNLGEKSQVVPVTANVTAEREVESEEAGLSLDPVAVSSFRDSLSLGDARAPSIGPNIEQELPSSEDLADPEAYARYEHQQHRRVLVSFKSAARQKQQELERWITEGRRRGVSEEKLQEALRKQGAIKDVLTSLEVEALAE